MTSDSTDPQPEFKESRGKRDSPRESHLQYGLIIPALNEAESIGKVLSEVPRHRFQEILVVDNGSRDGTAAAAQAAGARVIPEPRRGYGRACQAGLAALKGSADAVVFMDADGSDDPADLERLLSFFESGSWGLVMGSRVLGRSERGSLTFIQRFGNALTTRLIRWIWGVHYTDLGPLRVVSRDALARLCLQDPDFGWNVEMQAKAAMLGLRVAEIPVNYRQRRYGKSKISGTLKGSLQAGIKIILTIWRCWMSGR
jgi:glycosyltransferase involved in cell wall biosynthesis